MDVISELMGVPDPDRDQVRAWADGVMHRDEGVTDVPAASDRGVAQPDRLLPGDGRRTPQEADRRLDDGAAGGRDRRRPADRRRDPRVHVPDGDRRQRDHHQTSCQRGVLGPQKPGPAHLGLRRPLAGAAVGGGDLALRHLQPDPGPHGGRRAHPLRHDDPRRRRSVAAAGFGAPRRAGVRPTPTTSSSDATSVPSY